MTGHELIRALQALDDRDLILTVAWSECCPAYMECDKYHPISTVKRAERHGYYGGKPEKRVFLELEE